MNDNNDNNINATENIKNGNTTNNRDNKEDAINTNNKNEITHKLDMLLINMNKREQYYNEDGYMREEHSGDIYKSVEYKFYRKRIFQLVKDIMNKKNTDTEIKKSLGHFINHAIEYIQFNDKVDIIQDEYKDIDLELYTGFKISDNYKNSFECPYKSGELGIIHEETNKLLYNVNMNDNHNDIRDYFDLNKVNDKEKNKNIEFKFPQQKNINYIPHKIVKK